MLSKLFFPKKVRAIFTATAYYYNESFKLWSAREVEMGAKLLISQHGGGVGTALWSQEESHMVESSDLFYSWGWGQSNSKIKNMPASKLAYTKRSVSNRALEGDILCVINADIVNYMHSQYPMPVERHFIEYTNEIAQVYALLNSKARKSFRYRLYHTNYNRVAWGVEEKLVDIGLGKIIDKKGVDFYSRISNCKLAVIVYGQNTTMYETLSANFPTMLFWNPDHWEIREDAKECFSVLEQAGIYHVSAQSLCQKINEIHLDIDKWWHSKNTQKAVNLFCSKYATTKENHIEEWAVELKNKI